MSEEDDEHVLPGQPKADPMRDKFSLRIHDVQLRRAEALVEALDRLGYTSARSYGGLCRSDVLRQALMLGLTMLEEEG